MRFQPKEKKAHYIEGGKTAKILWIILLLKSSVWDIFHKILIVKLIIAVVVEESNEVSELTSVIC